MFWNCLIFIKFFLLILEKPLKTPIPKIFSKKCESEKNCFFFKNNIFQISTHKSTSSCAFSHFY